MGTALAAIALVAPWIVWLPSVSGGAALALFGALAIAGAWHGYGRMLARVSRREVSAPVAIYWGMAASSGLAGLSILLHVYDPRFIVIAGTVAHTADLGLRFHGVRTAVPTWNRHVVLPAVAVGVVGAIAILAGAGAVTARPFDDDGSVVAQIQRLVDTGTLGDAIGYARSSQLGGHVALSGLASAFVDPIHAHFVDGGLGLALVLALVYVRVRPHEQLGAVWTVIPAVVACALVIPTADFAPLWLPAGMIAALDVTIGDRRGGRIQLPLAILAGALAAMRSEYAVVGATYVVASWWRDRRDLRRAVVLGGTFIAMIVPYAFSTSLAWGRFGGAVHELSSPGHGLVRLAMFVAIAALATPLGLVIVQELKGRGPRMLALAIGLGLAAVTALGERPFANQLYWPLVVAMFAVLAIGLAMRKDLTTLALALVVLSCAIVRDAQAGKRGNAWAGRVHALLSDVEYTRHAAPVAAGYDAALASVPAGAVLAVWVARPELLDYARLDVIDLRTPRAARLAHTDPARFARMISRSGAKWLLIDADAPVALDAIAAEQRAVARYGATRLVEIVR